MAIISQETFDKFTEEEKKKIREDYSKFTNLSENGIDTEERIANFHLRMKMKEYFGIENLQPEPKIRTWEDVVKQYPHFKDDIDKLEHDILYGWNKLSEKLIASYKITKLIELGYGGMVTNEEWKDMEVKKYCITREKGKIDSDGYWVDRYFFIAFHTREQRKEFMSYPENQELVKQYYMV